MKIWKRRKRVVRVPNVETQALRCLEKAYCRILTGGHSTQYYLAPDGSVCAVGAIAVVDGVVRSAREPYTWRRIVPALSEPARMALALLDRVAAERHPERPLQRRWSGPLEWVNQTWLIDETPRRRSIVRDEILAIYVEAIARQRAVAEEITPSPQVRWIWEAPQEELANGSATTQIRQLQSSSPGSRVYE